MLNEDSGLKSKLLEKILELFSQLPDKDGAVEGLEGEAQEGEGLAGLEALGGLSGGMDKPKAF